jgi:lactate racemase
MTTTTDTGANRAVISGAAVLGGVGDILQPDQVSEFVAAAVAGTGIENKRVCLVVPDATRTCPLPLSHMR